MDRASQLGTLLGVPEVLGNCPVLSSAVQAVQGEGWFADVDMRDENLGLDI